MHNRTYSICFGDISGEFDQAMVRTLLKPF